MRLSRQPLGRIYKGRHILMKVTNIIKFGSISIGLYIIFSILSKNTPLLSVAGISIVSYYLENIGISSPYLLLITFIINLLFWFIIGGILGSIIKDEKVCIIIMIIFIFIITIISVDLGRTCCTSLKDIKWN
jgi:hypothetical protein